MKDNTVKLLGLEDVIAKNIWDDGENRHIEIERENTRLQDAADKRHIRLREECISPST